MKKFLWTVTFTLSLFLAMSFVLYSSGQEPGYPPAMGGQQEYEQGNEIDMDFNYMYDYLAPYGNWINLPPYGYVWTPRNMGYRWRPYSDGHWVMTEYGWTWISNNVWGSIPFHYGRWGYDNYFGWFWIPGTVWGPAWVNWRWNSQYVGWAPLPPGVEFNSGMNFNSLSFKTPNRFWIFLQAPYFLDPNINRYVLPYERNGTLINFTTRHNNIFFRNNRIVNEGIGIDQVRRITGRTVPRYTIRDVRNPRQVRVDGNNVNLYRPNIRKNTAAKPKTFLKRNEARSKLSMTKVFEPRSQQPVRAQELAVKKQQAQKKSLLEKTQSQELKNLESKRAKQLAQIRNQDEKSKISQNYQSKMAKLQKQHQTENQRLIKRNKQDLEKVKQIAKQKKEKQKKEKQKKEKK
jgi:hypothetical protein